MTWYSALHPSLFNVLMMIFFSASGISAMPTAMAFATRFKMQRCTGSLFRLNHNFRNIIDKLTGYDIHAEIVHGTCATGKSKAGLFKRKSRIKFEKSG